MKCTSRGKTADAQLPMTDNRNPSLVARIWPFAMLFVLCLMPAPSFGADRTGTTVFPLLKIGQGPRAAAMGESFTGLADDASAIYWNPAGLSQLTRHELSLSHQQWFAGIKDEIAHAVVPFGPGAIGLGLLYSGEPDVQYWDDQRLEFATFNAWSSVLTAGYGLRLADNYRLGATITGVYEYLREDRGIGGAVDVGFVCLPVAGLGIGVAARHLGTMSFGTGFEPLPMEIAAGATYALGKFKTTLDAVIPLLDNDPSLRAGIEYSPASVLAIRLGYRTGPVDLAALGLLSGLTGGVGLTVGGIGLDYAFTPYGELGMTHRIGLRTAIAPPAFGSQTIIVLDADTKMRLVANLAVTGVIDTTATTDEIELTPRKPGRLLVRAARADYKPEVDTFPVTLGSNRVDTMLLRELESSLAGTIYDAKTRQPIGGTLTYFRWPAHDEPRTTISVPAPPGTFAIEALRAGTYVLDAAGPNKAYLPQSCTLEIPPGLATRRDFYLWRKTDFLVLDGVNFETGKADILQIFYGVLDRAGQILKQTPAITKVELAGHTDPRDSNTIEAVRRYLISKWGIAPERLVAKGYADSQPISTNATPEGMARNRRTELRIIE